MSDANAKRVVGCLEYRSRNGFGGMNVGYSTWVFEKGGKFTFATDRPTTWNKYCAKQRMNDYTALGNQLLERLKDSLEEPPRLNARDPFIAQALSHGQDFGGHLALSLELSSTVISPIAWSCSVAYPCPSSTA